MPVRNRPEQTALAPGGADAGGALAKALRKLKKAELIDVILRLVGDDRRATRWLEAELNVAAAPSQLTASARQAIVDATAFDERDVGDNFDYDYAAYETVGRCFRRLVERGRYREAMALSLELMSRGSHQVEMSDEGLMTGDIEACLQVVIGALTTSGLSGRDVADWCAQMSAADRIGFISDAALKPLREQYPEYD